MIVKLVSQAYIKEVTENNFLSAVRDVQRFMEEDGSLYGITGGIDEEGEVYITIRISSPVEDPDSDKALDRITQSYVIVDKLYVVYQEGVLEVITESQYKELKKKFLSSK